MISRSTTRSVTCAIAHSTQKPAQPSTQPSRQRPIQLVLGTLLGIITIGSTAQTAAANPLQAIPIVGDLIRATRPAPQLPTDLDIFHDNVQGNHVNICTLTCAPVPGTRPPAPRSAPSPPVSQSAQPTSAQRPASNRPAVTVNMPPLNIPL